MEDNGPRTSALEVFSEAISSDPAVYTWHYDAGGTLISTNCPEHVYQKVFDHTGCLSYMLETGPKERTPLILSAELGIMWCAVFEYEEDTLSSCYVIGPVFNYEINPDILKNAIHKYKIDPAWRGKFAQIMTSLDSLSSIIFFQYAVILHYFVTGEKISRSDLRFQTHPPKRSSRGRPEDVEIKRNRHQTYQAEQALLKMVRDGDLNYRSAMDRAGQISSGVGITTGDPVKRAILSASNFTALCTRAAIKGGLTPDTAYTVGDSYIQSLTECRTISDVRQINHAMYDDFIQRVNRQRRDPHYSQQVQECVSYIEMHSDEPLTLESLAKMVGYSEYHLSRKFKAETGKNIRDYIKYTRIEKAKHLLASTDLSIKEISENLCFCSTSHFANAFRDVTGKLPREFRSENYK